MVSNPPKGEEKVGEKPEAKTKPPPQTSSHIPEKRGEGLEGGPIPPGV